LEEHCSQDALKEENMEYFKKLFVVAGVMAREGFSERKKQSISFSTLLLLVCLAWPTLGRSEGRVIDVAHSTLTVYVYKTGFLSPLAHNHEIEAPIEWGEVKDTGSSSVELRVRANTLRVSDAEVSDDTRAKIQETMRSAQVLDVDHFPEIHFQSAQVEARGPDHWIVHGNLDLHGQTHPVSVDVALKDGLYRGTATLKQTQFGITPVRLAGGTVKVKDEIKVDFSIALVK
jgi:polyisoprenoid-binding protein YceI